MLKGFLAVVDRVLLVLVTLRYRVTVKGSEVLQDGRPHLILPNHQALVDPFIVVTEVYRFVPVVPVVLETYFHLPVLRTIFRIIGGVPVSDLSMENRNPDVLREIMSGAIDALQQRQSILLYPSGQLAGQGYEKIFNKQSAWAIAATLPADARIIGLRLSGLWGSMWSRAWVGESPHVGWTALKALFYLAANLFFFLPRRDVTLEFADITQDAVQRAKLGRNEFNLFLESFYNAGGEEPVRFLKHYFYAPALKRKLPERVKGSVADIETTLIFTEEDVPEDVLREVTVILVRDAHVDEKAVTLNANLSLDLHIDSLGLVNVVMTIEERFHRKADVEIATIKTVADLCLIAMNRKIDNEILKPCELDHLHSPVTRIVVDPDATIPSLLLKSLGECGKDAFVYDKLLGTTTRRSFLLKAYVVANILKEEVEGDHVGIMLPALQSTTLLVAATYLAGKIPVMLNWTGGPKVMSHCVEHVNLRQVLTARSFFNRIADLLPQDVKDRCVFLEEKVKAATLGVKLSGLLSFCLRRAPRTRPEDVAVVLFTSGSESLPKAVALTHRNVLSDLHGSLDHININTDEILLAFLPPFHSFGFTVLTVLPLAAAVKTAYTPDPTDSREVLKILLHTRSTVLVGTPTFLKMLLAISTGNDLKHIRLAVSGAESLHASVLETFVQKTGGKADLLEGYGITECAPVLTLNPRELQKLKSVGTFIKGVEGLVVDLNTNEPLPSGREGMILVRGPNIFSGYRDPALASPFVIVNGAAWYRTGDLGYIDGDGYLFITGRLKRFIKIAGEMISLPAIEEALLEKFGDPEKTVLAVVGDDKVQPPRIVLFATQPIALVEANQYLAQSGFSNLARIHAVQAIDEIPLLGTGKTDYKRLT